MRHFLALLCLLACCQWLSAQNAQLQIINNSADPTLATADFWIDEVQVQDVDFRSSSPFIEVPASQSLRVGVAPGASSSSSESFSISHITFDPGKRYILIASGLLNPADFSDNPAGTSTEFTLLKIGDVPTDATVGQVNVMIVHGVTDAPMIDIEADGTTLAKDLLYGMSTPFMQTPASMRTLTVAPSGGSAFLAYKADLTEFSGQTIVLLTSGFLIPFVNQSGLPFGMFAVTDQGGPFKLLPGTVVPTMANVQFVHNAADPALDAVDLYIGNVLARGSFRFRTASPFTQVPTDTDIKFGVAPAASTSSAAVFSWTTVNLAAGRYEIILSGVKDTTAFAPNPDVGAPTLALSLMSIPDILPSGKSPTALDMIYMNGCTDCPAVDVYHATTRVASNLVYGMASEYASLEAGPTTVVVTNKDGDKLRSIPVDVSAWAGEASIVLLSGFLNPPSNQQGARMGLWATRLEGGPLQELGTVTSVSDTHESSVDFYPNPTSGYVSVSGLPSNTITILITDAVGRTVLSVPAHGDRVMFDVTALAPGLYYVRTIGNHGEASMAKLLCRVP